MKQFLSVCQLEYSAVDVVQMRFMQFHSLTSSQHMTIRCTSSQASVLGTANSIKGWLHLLGDSGNEIGSRLTTVDSGDGEVRRRALQLFWFGSADAKIAGLVINVELIAHIAKAYMFFLNIFQIAVVVKTQGNVEQHQQDREVLPVRDFGVDTRSLSALEPEFAVNIGPLCFL